MSDHSIINPLESVGYAREKEVTLKLAAISADIGRLEAKVEALFTTHSKHHDHLKEALDLAADVLKDKLTEMNQFRAQIDQERLDYVRREMLNQAVDSLDGRIDTLEATIRAAMEGQEKAVGARIKPLEETRTSIYTIVAVVAVGLTVLGLALRFL